LTLDTSPSTHTEGKDSSSAFLISRVIPETEYTDCRGIIPARDASGEENPFIGVSFCDDPCEDASFFYELRSYDAFVFYRRASGIPPFNI
jgi:hypothetical protein